MFCDAALNKDDKQKQNKNSLLKLVVVSYNAFLKKRLY